MIAPRSALFRPWIPSRAARWTAARCGHRALRGASKMRADDIRPYNICPAMSSGSGAVKDNPSPVKGWVKRRDYECSAGRVIGSSSGAP